MSHAYRVVVVGSGGVGKSCLTIQYIANRFVADYDPTLEDSYRKQASVNGFECVLDIVDTAGQHEFTAIRESYYVDGDGFVCVYDVTAKVSFQEVEEFHQSILRVKDVDFVPFILVGNKCDMEGRRQVSKEEGEALAKKLRCRFIEASAKSRKNVDELFAELVKEIMKHKNKGTPDRDDIPSSGSDSNTRKSSKSMSDKKKRCMLF